MKYNGQEIGIPEVWQIAEYIALKGFHLSAQAIYDKYKAQGWVKSNGREIKSLEAIVNAQNGVMIQKKRKGFSKEERKACDRLLDFAYTKMKELEEFE